MHDDGRVVARLVLANQRDHVQHGARRAGDAVVGPGRVVELQNAAAVAALLPRGPGLGGAGPRAFLRTDPPHEELAMVLFAQLSINNQPACQLWFVGL